MQNSPSSKLSIALMNEPGSSSLPGSQGGSHRTPDSGTTLDIINLFSHLGATAGAATYQEVRSDADARIAAARWPLLSEWQDGEPSEQFS